MVERFNRFDLLALLTLLIISALLNFTALDAYEFFRHTEADRTLIAWEMLERGDFVLPHILGSPILTKPPIFYWLVALSMSLFGTTAEWAARVPSAIAATLLVMLQYLFLRFGGFSTKWALLGTMFLCTGVLYLYLSNAAEIDMVYGLLCSATLYLAYFATTRASLLLTLSAYVIAAVAFLTKGPPVLVFLVLSHLLYYAWFHRRHAKIAQTLPQFITANTLGAVLFVLIAFCWVSLVADRVGWGVLGEQVRVELLERFFEGSSNKRGIFFYVGAILSNLLPWTVFFVLGLALPFYRKAALSYEKLREDEPLWSLFIFHVVVVSSSVIFLSLAQGKSTRYMFPLYPFAVSLSLFGLYHLRMSKALPWLFMLASFVSGLVIVCAISAPFFPQIAVLNLDLRPVMLFSALAALVMFYGSIKRLPEFCFIGIFLLLGTVRFAEKTVFAPFRNESRSVKGIVEEIKAIVPEDSTIYSIEMFERWIVYYLKRDHRNVVRASPTTISTLLNDPAAPERVILLLSSQDEGWRPQQLQRHDKTLKIVAELSTEQDEVMLVEIATQTLKHIEPLPMIPTVPSKPYYMDHLDETH